MQDIEVKRPDEARPNTEALSLEEFSITELEDRIEFCGRCAVQSLE